MTAVPVLDVDLLSPYNPLRPSFQPVQVLVWAGSRVLGELRLPPIWPGAADGARAQLLANFSSQLLASHELGDARPLRGPAAQDVTVVVCTRDRPRLLHDCLGALRQLDPAPAEIVLVDSGASQGSTRQIAKEAGARHVADANGSAASARNLGWQSARTSIVAYVADDARVHSAYVGALAAGFAVPAVGAVTGLVVAAELETRPQRLLDRMADRDGGYIRQLFDGRCAFAPLSGQRFATAGNLAFRREILDALGGFDPRLNALAGNAASAGGADLDVLYRTLREGHALAYEPSAVVRRVAPRDWPGLFTQMHENGAAMAAVFAKYEREVTREARLARRERRSWHLRRHVRAPVAALRRREPWRIALLLAEAAGSRRTRKMLSEALAEVPK